MADDTQPQSKISKLINKVRKGAVNKDNWKDIVGYIGIVFIALATAIIIFMLTFAIITGSEITGALKIIGIASASVCTLIGVVMALISLRR